MAMMRIYRAPDGRLYQYREGNAPEGYVLHEPEAAEPEEAPKAKRRAPKDKARRAEDK